jgi:hypothetical protein
LSLRHLPYFPNLSIVWQINNKVHILNITKLRGIWPPPTKIGVCVGNNEDSVAIALDLHKIANLESVFHALHPSLMISADRTTLTNLLELHTRHCNGATTNLTGLTYVLTAIGPPSLDVLLPILFGIESNNRASNSLSIASLHTSIGNSSFKAELFNAIGTLVNLAANIPLSTGGSIEGNFTMNTSLVKH